MFRFAQQWINLDHVAHIKVNLPKTDLPSPSCASIEVTFSSGKEIKIESDEWKDMKTFSTFFNPLVAALEETAAQLS